MKIGKQLRAKQAAYIWIKDEPVYDCIYLLQRPECSLAICSKSYRVLDDYPYAGYFNVEQKNLVYVVYGRFPY